MIVRIHTEEGEEHLLNYIDSIYSTIFNMIKGSHIDEVFMERFTDLLQLAFDDMNTGEMGFMVEYTISYERDDDHDLYNVFVNLDIGEREYGYVISFDNGVMEVVRVQ